MSSTIDNRVVQMNFDNRNFETNVQTSLSTLDKLKNSLRFDGAEKGFDNINNASKNLNMSPIASAVEDVKNRFSALELIAITALVKITNAALDAGKEIASALTIDPIKMGFEEYETQIGAVQTILANTSHNGTSLQQVNMALDDLNTYADKTIYNFTQMSKNIGTFTAAGVDLDTATNSIKGIANLAAVSGSTSQQASTAMYQLSQALAAGKVSLMDWNSVVNAGMGGKVFQDALLRTSEQLKTGGKEAVAQFGSFRESLTKGAWLTKDVLTETLKQFAGFYTEADLLHQGFTKEQAAAIVKMAKTAEDAATKVKTFSQLWDTLKEAAQSGWTQSWEIIIGDFEEAKELLTGISDGIGKVLQKSADARNKLLSEGLSSGWKQLLDAGIHDESWFIRSIDKTAKKSGTAFEKIRKDSTSFGEALKKGLESGAISSDTLRDSIMNLHGEIHEMSEGEQRASHITAENVEQLDKLVEGLKNGSISMDEFTKKIMQPSGRENIFQGLFNIAEALMKIAQPIKEAFRDIFPAMTGNQLYKITEEFRKFTEHLIISDKTSENLKNTFKGLFSVLDIFKQAFGAIFKVIKEFIGVLPNVGSGILEVTGKFGNWISSINEYIKKNEIFTKASDAVVKTIKSIFDAINNLLPSFDNMTNGLGGIGKTIGSVFKNIGKFVADGVGKIGEAFANMDFSQIGNLAGGGILGSMALGIKKFFDSLTNTIDGASGILEGVSDLLNGVRQSLELYQQNLKANILQKIAIAIGILAGSLFLLSKIDPEKVGSAMVLMVSEFGALYISLEAFSKLTSGSTMTGLWKIIPFFIGLSTAVLILSKAMQNLAQLDWDQLLIGLTGLAGISAILVKSAQAMSGSTGPMIKGASGLILFAVAIRFLVKPVQELAQLDLESLAKGLAGVGILMAELSLFMSKTNFDGMGLLKGAGIALLAVSINLLAQSVSKFSEMDTGKMIQGLASVGALLAELAVFTKLTSGSTGMIPTAIGLTILATSMSIFGDAINKMGSMDLNTLIQGLSGLAVALLMSAAAIKVLPPNTPLIAVGMVLMAQALKMIADAVLKLKDMSLTEMGTSLLAIAGALTAVVVAANLMNGAVAGAGALLLVSAGLALLTPSLKALGKMSLAEIGTSLLVLAGAFTVIGAAGILLGPLVPVLIGLAGAIALLGIGTAAVGGGILALSMGLGALAVSGAAGIGTLVLAIKSIIGLIPYFLEQVAQGIIITVTTIGNAAPQMIEAVSKIIGSILVALEDNIPKLLSVIETFLDELLKKAPKFIKIGVELIKAFITGIKENIADIVDLVVDTVLATIEAVIAQIPKIGQAGVDIVLGLINGLADGINKNTPRIKEAFENLFKAIVNAVLTLLGIHSPSTVFDDIGKNIIEGLKQGIANMAQSAIQTITTLITNIIGAVTKRMGEFLTKGQELMTNVKNGIAAKMGEITQTVSTIITTVVNGIGSRVGEFLSKGQALMDNLRNGINGKAEEIKSAVTNILSGILSAIQKKVGEFVSIGANLMNGMKRGIQRVADEIVDSVVSTANNAVSGAKRILGIHSPSRVFAEIGEYTGEGFIVGLSRLMSKVEESAVGMGQSAITGISSAILSISDYVNTTIDSEPTIKPVLDLSNVTNGANKLNNLLSADKSIGLAISDSNTMNSKLAVNQNGLSINNDNVVNAINDLRKDVNLLMGGMSKLQVILDTGTLVGQIASPINEHLGQQIIYDGRGI